MKLKTIGTAIVLFVTSIGVISSFQNCSVGISQKGTAQLSQSAVLATTTQGAVAAGRCTSDQIMDISGRCINNNAIINSCQLNGQMIANNSSVKAYSQMIAPPGTECPSELRTCQNGILSGSYSSLFCQKFISSPAPTTTPETSTLPAATCLFNGNKLNVGQSTVAFFASASANCVSQTRICLPAGVLSGSYPFAACQTLSTQARCGFNGASLLPGAMVTAYFSTAGNVSQPCQTESRTCQENGLLTGSFAFDHCSLQNGTVTPPTSSALCTFNNIRYQVGNTINAYQTEVATATDACIPKTKVCADDGLFTLPNYKFTTCFKPEPVLTMLEQKSALEGFYTLHLHRSGTPAEIQDWLTQITSQKITLEQARVAIASSPEAEIQYDYRNFLRRFATLDEVSYWISVYNKGTSLINIKSEIMNSDEALKLNQK